MPHFLIEKKIQHLPPAKGGYHYLEIEAETVLQFKRKAATPLLCELEDQLTIAVRLSLLKGENYAIVLERKHLLAIAKKAGDTINIKLYEDPNPLGIENPAVLVAILEHDAVAEEKFERLSKHEKKEFVEIITPIADLENQVNKIFELLNALK